jgi:thymidylate synthase (FAD)
MNVKLISYSKAHEPSFWEHGQSIEGLQSNFEVTIDGDDNPIHIYKNGSVQELIAFCARVSNPNNQFNTETSEKLIKYLVKHQHWSPLEMVSACIEIETTRDIARQILRHRSFSFQEFSQRYADPTKDLSFVVREARLQDPKNRQNSIDTDNLAIHALWENHQKRVIEQAMSAYEWAINNGIAKEQARAVLPEGLTMSRMYMNGTLRSWIHYIQLRSANGTQKEHMEIAKACASVIAEIFPMSETFVE